MTLVAQRTVTGAEVRPNLTLDRRRRRLSTIVAKHADRSRPHIVSVHRRGEPLAPDANMVRMQKEWSNTLVGPQDVVIITYLPQGGAGGGASIAMAVAAIALMVIVPWAIGALGAGTFLTTAAGGLSMAGKLLSTNIIIGGMALLSQANKPKANKADETRPIYGVSGGGNLPRPGDRIPRLYGRCWTTPDLSQSDFFTYDGDYQILYKRMVVSLGRVKIHRVRVGGQLLWSDDGTADGMIHAPFTGSRIERISPGETSSFVPRDVVSSSSVQGIELPRPGSTPGWAGPFVISGPDIEVDKIQIDFQAPQGAIKTYTNSKGANEAGAPLGWVFQYSPVNAAGVATGPWKTLHQAEMQLLERQAVRWTRTLGVPPGRYAVRGRNLFGNEPFNERETGIVNGLQWDGLRGYRKERRVRQNVTELALKIKSSASLGVTSFADVEVEATGIVPVWNGSAWVNEPTRKAVWIYADIMRNATYGAAIPDSAFDKDTAKFYADTLAMHDTFDGVIRGPDSVWNAAAVVLMPMRAEPVQLGRIWSLVRDEPKATRRHVIAQRQIVKGSSGLSFNLDADNGDAHVIAEFHHSGDPKRLLPAQEVWYGNKSMTPTRRNLFGVSTWAHANVLARWMAASAFYRRQMVRFTTEHDGRMYKRGDSIMVELWFTGQAKVASVVSVSGNTLTFDRTVPVAPNDHIVLRDRSGREWGPVAILDQGSSQNQVILDAASRAAVEASTGISLVSALALDIMEETTALVAQVNYLRRNYLVKSATPSGRDRVDVEAVIDAQEVWDAIGATISPDPYNEGYPTNDVIPPSNLTMTERIYNDGRVRSAVDLAWTKSPDQRALLTEVQYRIVPGSVMVEEADPEVIIEPSETDGMWQTLTATDGSAASILDLPACVIDVRIRSIYSALNTSVWVERLGVSVLGLTAPPEDVAGFEASVLGDYMRLTWDAEASPHLSHYEVRFSPQLSGVTWGSAVPLIPRTTATTEQVPAAAGTYLIKAVSLRGVDSANAAIVSSDVAVILKMNVIETFIEQPGFAGSKTDVVLNPAIGGIHLDYSEDVYARDDWYAPGLDWYLGSSGLALEGAYNFSQSLDLGAVYTSRLTAALDAHGVNLTDDIYAVDDVYAMEDFYQTAAASLWDVRLEYRTTNDNPAASPTWSEWKPVIIGDVTARALQFRVCLFSYEFGVTPVVTRLEVSIDMPDRHEGGNDLMVPTGGLRIDFVPPFLSLKGLGITAENMATGDYYRITNRTETGFDIRFFNSSNTPVARTFDYVVTGRGRREV